MTIETILREKAERKREFALGDDTRDFTVATSCVHKGYSPCPIWTQMSYETCIFTDEGSMIVETYSSEAEARRGHERWVHYAYNEPRVIWELFRKLYY